jgi:hypothetical protein
MIKIMNKAEENEEMEIASGEDDDYDEDDNMEVDFMSIGEKRKGGGGRA